MADPDGKTFLEGVGVIGGIADILDVIEELFQAGAVVAEDDQALAGIAARSPEPKCLVAADGGR